MAGQLVILGTSVTLPDPASVSDLAARFQEQGGQLAEAETTLQALARPDAWGEWTGLAADAFGQSIGQLPAELGEVCAAYEEVAAALRQYAGQLEPVVGALSSLSYPAEEAEYTLAATERARAQAIAHGQTATIPAWNIRVADAAEAVAELRRRLNGLLAELNALASTCTRQIKAAEPRSAHKSLFGQLESDFVRDVADPLARAAKETAKLAEEAAKLELSGAVGLVEALYIHPLEYLWDEVSSHAEEIGKVLSDVAIVLTVLAFIPGVDAIAGPALVIVSAAEMAADWYAVYDHQKGASVLQASLATLSFGCAGVGLVATKALSADSELVTSTLDDNGLGAVMELKDGEGAVPTGEGLWRTGLQRAFSPSDIKASISDNYETALDPVGKGDAPTGLQGFQQALSNNFSSKVTELRNGGIEEFVHTPAAVTIEHVKWVAEGLDDLGHVQELANKMAGG
jgi:uncharacterized protein YukE